MNKISTWLFIGIISALFFACTAEKDKGDYLKGRVLLDGQPAGGVLVRLYDYPQVNDTLEYLQSQYPGIGVKVTRQLNFDKNALTVIREVYSDKNGNWEMDNLSTGSFAVVYLKDGLCKNQYGITVGTGATNAGDFNFGKPFIYKNDSTITGNVTWPAGSSVYIQGKIVLDDNATLTVEPGVSIAFSDSAADHPKGELAIYGKAEFVGTEENYITFSGLGELKNAWNGVKVGERAEGKFRYCAFYNGFGALTGIKSIVDIRNCSFFNNTTALAVEINKNSSFTSLSLINNRSGLSFSRPDSLDCSLLFFYRNVNGMKLYGPGEFDVNNNLFFKSTTAFSAVYSLTGVLNNCEFDFNKTAVYLSGEKTAISYCDFNNSVNHDILIKPENNSVNSQAEFTNNNFLSNCEVNAYYIGYSWGVNQHDLKGDNNYWNGLTDSLLIADKIYDKFDAGVNAPYTGRILFWPVASQEISGSGINRK